MKRILYGLIIGFCLIPNIVNALECSTADRERLQKLANNISVAIEEYEENGDIGFVATFTGVSKDVRIFNNRVMYYYRNDTNDYIGYFTVQPLYVGNVYEFTVNGNTTCVDYNFRTITINVPNYNQYYNDPICENAREYKLCQKWINNSDLSYEKFVSEVTDYIQKHKKANNSGTTSTTEMFYIDLERFYKTVYFPSLVVTLILVGLLIYFWSKKNKKNKL